MKGESLKAVGFKLCVSNHPAFLTKFPTPEFDCASDLFFNLHHPERFFSKLNTCVVFPECPCYDAWNRHP
ncbi:unnamed protein product [Cuscuta campestris]|uniref:Uncharacterized protein n=1 Tax=Cuscuta campestris TaxID=132261 RepID=A0A484M3R5_9ASTE|nr:unnamed protein product [Cuscuta campestris]